MLVPARAGKRADRRVSLFENQSGNTRLLPPATMADDGEFDEQRDNAQQTIGRFQEFVERDVRSRPAPCSRSQLGLSPAAMTCACTPAPPWRRWARWAMAWPGLRHLGSQTFKCTKPAPGSRPRTRAALAPIRANR